MKYNKKIIVGTFVLFFMNGFLHAKVRAVRDRRDFEQTLSKNSMVVVLFYEDEKGNKTVRNKNRGLTRMYEDLSTYQSYNDADIIFLKVNIGRKELAELASLYAITDVPSFTFFNNSNCVLDDSGARTLLTGFVSRVDLQAFIDEHYGRCIKQYIAQKEERRRRIIREENESWKPYFYPRDVFVRDYDPAEPKMNME